MNKLLEEKKIRLLVSDFDGVMTDNKVLVDAEGNESVFVNRSDGLGIRILRDKGIDTIILSTEENKVVSARAKKLNIDCYQGIKNKRDALLAISDKYKVPLCEIAYIGNDINDYEALLLAGLRVAPSDAYEEILEIADIVTRAKGGGGVIRELV